MSVPPDKALPHHVHAARLAAAREVQRKPGWQPKSGSGPSAHLDALKAKGREINGEKAYAEAAFCQACTEARTESATKVPSVQRILPRHSADQRPDQLPSSRGSACKRWRKRPGVR